MKLIKLNDKMWINPDEIQYILKADFIKGYVIYFNYSSRLTINDDEFKSLMKQTK